MLVKARKIKHITFFEFIARSTDHNDTKNQQPANGFLPYLPVSLDG